MSREDWREGGAAGQQRRCGAASEDESDQVSSGFISLLVLQGAQRPASALAGAARAVARRCCAAVDHSDFRVADCPEDVGRRRAARGPCPCCSPRGMVFRRQRIQVKCEAVVRRSTAIRRIGSARTRERPRLSPTSVAWEGSVHCIAMTWHNKVIWTEGMFLQPQHFQQHDRYTEQPFTVYFSRLIPHWLLIAPCRCRHSVRSLSG